MKITKLPQSCLHIAYKGRQLLVDPGNFVIAETIAGLPPIDIVLITHKHGDHFVPEYLDVLQKKNDKLIIITNAEVAEAYNAPVTVLEGSDTHIEHDITFTAHDAPHEEIYKSFGSVQNTGYYIDDMLFCPGDAFTIPTKKTKLVAIPITAPFLAVKEVIRYCNATPEVQRLGVHDGVASEKGRIITEQIIRTNLAEGIQFTHLSEGEALSP